MRHFLSINDFSKGDIAEIFRIATDIKKGNEEGLLQGKRLALLFEKNSTRTYVSFDAAMNLLGGHSVYLASGSSQISRGETYADTARTLSRYQHLIAARLYRHSDLLELAKAATIPVINALTDLEHPCQALSDAYTMTELKGELKGRRIAFIGDIAANTSNSLMLAATKLGAEMRLVGPREVKPEKAILKTAQGQGKVEVFSDIKRGLEDSDFVYTDTWVSMGEEAEAAKRNKLFEPYQLNRKALGYAKKDAMVMHCLPAHRGKEITADVLDGRQSIVWQQAENKMFVEASILTYLSIKT
jgi:ornithine carbamoyltransferase